MAIDIGEEAVDTRDSYNDSPNYTLVAKDNPANASGTITSVEVFSISGYDFTDFEVGIFYTTNGDTLKCRSTHSIGAVEGGAKRTFSGLSLAVEAGDFIGCYWTTGSTGRLYRDTSGFAGIWYFSGRAIDVNDEENYSTLAGDAISLKGIGEEAAPPAGRSFGFIIG